MTERMVDVDGVRLCTETFGDPTDPPVLLIMGPGASMLWWDESHDDPGQHPPLSSITVPTSVVHGTADPMLPVAHGLALADEVPDATLLVLDGAGHGVDRADWQTIVPAILRHTVAPAPAEAPRSRPAAT